MQAVSSKTHPALPAYTPKPQKKSRLWLPIIFLGIGTLGYFFGGLILPFIFSNVKWLQISDVKINAEAPLQAADVNRWLPAIQGKNLLLLNADSLLSLIQSESWVREASVRKEFPNRLVINVQTRQPEALAMSHGLIYFVDAKGWIARWESASSKSKVLPLLQWEKESYRTEWELSEILARLTSLRQMLSGQAEVSQLVMSHYPYVKAFLVSPQIEIQMSVSDWESQLERLKYLMLSPPRALLPIRSINLILPKKAVVSSHTTN